MHKHIIQPITTKSNKVICVCTVCSFFASLLCRYFVHKETAGQGYVMELSALAQLLNLTLPRVFMFYEGPDKVSYLLLSLHIMFGLHCFPFAFRGFSLSQFVKLQFHCYLVLVFLLCTEAHHEQIQRSERKAKGNLNPHPCHVFMQNADVRINKH